MGVYAMVGFMKSLNIIIVKRDKLYKVMYGFSPASIESHPLNIGTDLV